MKIECPRCQREVDATRINVAADVAFCCACQEAFALSKIVGGLREGSGVLSESLVQPGGTWFEKGPDGFTARATTRSAAAFFLIPFTCVWSGLSLGNIYGSQITNGRLNLFMCLFGIPFVLGTVMLVSKTMMSICGEVKITVRREEGTVFVGIGSVGWRRRFNPDGIRRVYEEVHTGSKTTTRRIILEGAERIAFGGDLNDNRRYFLLEILRRLLVRGP